MQKLVNLDLDALRTFVLGFQYGSFMRAASAVGRSQSAVSGQLRKLEAQIGEPLVRKSGRGLELTEAGGHLLTYARRLLDLNDEAVASVRTSRQEGKIRFGLPADFAETWLPELLGRFIQAHPRVQIEVQAEGSARLRADLIAQRLDLVLAWGDGSEAPGGEHLADVPVAWIGRAGWKRPEAMPQQPLAMVVHDAPCIFRATGLEALDGAGMSYRIAFNSSNLYGLWAALGAGLGVTVRSTIGMPPSLAPVDQAKNRLPQLSPVPVSLYGHERGADGPTALLADLIRTSISGRLANMLR